MAQAPFRSVVNSRHRRQISLDPAQYVHAGDFPHFPSVPYSRGMNSVSQEEFAQVKGVGPKKLQPVHVAMLDYIMANPGCTYEQVAASCGGYSIGWVSQIVNSDAFQALLAERQGECFGDVKLTIKDRITGVAQLSLKRIAELLPTQTDPDKVVNAADLALKALGFGQPSRGPQTPVGAGPTQNNFIIGSVDAQTLAAARELMHGPKSLPAPAGEPPAIEHQK